MKRGKYVKNVEINGEKLRELLKKNGINASELGVNTGYGRNYLSNALPHNSISKVVVNFLELQGIHFEDYAPDPEPTTVDLIESSKEGDQKGISIADLTPDQFSKLIYQAVYEATHTAWKDM